MPTLRSGSFVMMSAPDRCVDRSPSVYFFGAIIVPPIFSQVPFSTYFQSPASLSLVAVPAQECEPDALAQSFWPALATPKHLSLLASGATGPACAAEMAPNASIE